MAVGSAVATTQGFFLYFIISSPKTGPMDPPWQSSELTTDLPQLPVSSHLSGQTNLCIFVTASTGRQSGILWLRQPLGHWDEDKQTESLLALALEESWCSRAVAGLVGKAEVQEGQLDQPSAQSCCEWQIIPLLNSCISLWLSIITTSRLCV